MLKLKTKQAMEEASEVPPPLRKSMEEIRAEAGACGKLWRSGRGRNQRLLGDYWCICISLELCCFITQEHSNACTILNDSLTAGFGLQIMYLTPTCPWKGSPASCSPALARTSLAAFPMQQHHHHSSDFRELNWQKTSPREKVCVHRTTLRISSILTLRQP